MKNEEPTGFIKSLFQGVLGPVLGALVGLGGGAALTYAGVSTSTLPVPNTTVTTTAVAEVPVPTESAPAETSVSGGASGDTTVTVTRTVTETTTQGGETFDAGVRRAGQGIALLQLEFIDLDSDAPNWGIPDDGSAGDVSYNAAAGLSGASGIRLAPVDGDPDPQTCSDQTLYVQSISRDIVTVDSHFCVERNGEPLAKLRVSGYNDSPSAMIVDVTVWES